jgi:hypothetical protein
MVRPCLTNEASKIVGKRVTLFTVRNNKKKKKAEKIHPSLEMYIWTMEIGRTNYYGN